VSLPPKAQSAAFAGCGVLLMLGLPAIGWLICLLIYLLKGERCAGAGVDDPTLPPIPASELADAIVTPMKALSNTLVLIGVIALLVYTNPSLESYSRYVRQQMLRGSSNPDAPGGGLNAALGGVAGYFIRNASTRSNYVIFSLYHTNLGSKPISCVGALDNFFACKNLPNATDRR
jgi:hypothetical protein